ncbi:hypothetical protein B0H13DRAFT_2345464 [Mycena leptocephala]|nr:hypothetical protein B0H13DRAFT_2345464 [Mycena leptocephala]
MHAAHLPPAVLSPPPLPALRCIKFTLSNADCGGPWFQDTILAPQSSPGLTTIVIIFHSNSSKSSVRLEHELMAALDHALIAHPAVPLIRWRIPGGAFSHFLPWIQDEMANVHEKGQLVVEAAI